MASIQENKFQWNDKYRWREGGEEWSDRWGTSSMQWYGTILPRIQAFLPALSILEIAPGLGRWTKFLKSFCSELILVDLSEKCINTCRERFSSDSHIKYFVNDGKSLDMVPDGSVDFIFSFDSLVHADEKTINIYIAQFPRILKSNGVAFIHHSNLGEYANYIDMQRKLSKIPKLLGFLIKSGLLDSLNRQWRDPSMTADKMRKFAEENGLRCITQELIPWGTKWTLIDCLSVIVKKESEWPKGHQLFRNFSFMKEANNLRILSRIYDFHLDHRSIRNPVKTLNIN